MTPAQRFQLCAEQARRIVSAYRAAAPAGCDPQNTWVAAGVAVVGTAATAYSAYSSSKGGSGRSTGEMSGLPYKEQLKQANAYSKAQLKTDKDYAKFLLKMGPQFAAQQVAFQKQAAQAALELYPGFAEAERKETDKTRADDLGDLQQYGAGYVGAFGDANPVFRQILDEAAAGPSALQGKMNIEALLAGRSPLGAELEAQALADLQLGRALSPEEERDAGQSSRAAFAARGLNFSNAAIGNEILNRDAFGRDRQAQRRQFGMGVMGLIGNEDEANRRFELNVEGANSGWRNYLLAAEGATSRPLYAALGTRAPSNVMGGVLGAMGLGYDVGQTNASMSGAPSIYQGAQALTPIYNYGAQVHDFNANASAAAATNSANAWGAIGSGVMSLGGQALGSYSGGGSPALGSTNKYGGTYMGQMNGQTVYRPALA